MEDYCLLIKKGIYLYRVRVKVKGLSVYRQPFFNAFN
jgi:hypothetical protein